MVEDFHQSKHLKIGYVFRLRNTWSWRNLYDAKHVTGGMAPIEQSWQCLDIEKLLMLEFTQYVENKYPYFLNALPYQLVSKRWEIVAASVKLAQFEPLFAIGKGITVWNSSLD